MPSKGFLSIPDRIGTDFGSALGAELARALAQFGTALKTSTLRISLEITVDLESKETMTKARMRALKK